MDTRVTRALRIDLAPGSTRRRSEERRRGVEKNRPAQGARTRSRLLNVAVLSCILFTGVQHRHGMVAQENAAAARFLGKSRLLCAVLAPSQGIGALSARHDSGDFVDTWSVTCLDARQNERAHLMWNARSGRLMQFAIMEESAPGLPRVSASTVTGWARGSLRLMDDTTRDDWRLVRVPVDHGHTVWTTQWASAERRALVHLSARSGEVIAASFWHNPVAANRADPHTPFGAGN
jgi:hypothetical protein